VEIQYAGRQSGKTAKVRQETADAIMKAIDEEMEAGPRAQKVIVIAGPDGMVEVTIRKPARCGYCGVLLPADMVNCCMSCFVQE